MKKLFFLNFYIFVFVFFNFAKATDYLIHKNNWQVSNEKEHGQVYNILTTYQFPMSLAKRNKKVLSQLEKNNFKN